MAKNRIEVMLAYRKPDNTLIERGIYDASDLSEYVDYLIKAGHAKWIDAPHEPAETILQEAETESVPSEDAPQSTRRRRSTKRKASN